MASFWASRTNMWRSFSGCNFKCRILYLNWRILLTTFHACCRPLARKALSIYTWVVIIVCFILRFELWISHLIFKHHLKFAGARLWSSTLHAIDIIMFHPLGRNVQICICRFKSAVGSITSVWILNRNFLFRSNSRWLYFRFWCILNWSGVWHETCLHEFWNVIHCTACCHLFATLLSQSEFQMSLTCLDFNSFLQIWIVRLWLDFIRIICIASWSCRSILGPLRTAHHWPILLVYSRISICGRVLSFWLLWKFRGLLIGHHHWVLGVCLLTTNRFGFVNYFWRGISV